MPSPFKTQVADKLWALLDARAELVPLVKAGSKIRNNLSGLLSEIIRRTPAEFPLLKLSIGRNTNSGFGEAAQTYAQEHLDFLASGGDAVVRRRHEYLLTIIAQGKVDDNIDTIEEEAQTALLLGGPRLSEGAGDPLNFVIAWGGMSADQRVAPDINGIERLHSFITIPVLFEHSVRDLIS